ncbi:hypothetical protein B0H11DRAFT_1070290 [Mycena galericulata]|nr:hypothetical protein B0H11DRAFT_1070290 [Mycena galericulata]
MGLGLHQHCWPLPSRSIQALPVVTKGQLKTCRNMRWSLLATFVLKPRPRKKWPFSQISGAQQGIWIAAHLSAIEERLDALQPAESVYHIPMKLQGKIDMLSFLVLVDPTVPAYLTKEVLLKRVQAHLEKNPTWGWTAEVKGDKSKTKQLIKRIRSKLTHGRSDIKTLLEKSIGTVDEDKVRHDHKDLYALTAQIVALGSRLTPDIKVSLDLCVRVAVLRAKVQKYPGPDFWTKVDDSLARTRLQKNNDPDRISEVFARFYEADLETFKGRLTQAELTALNAVRPAVFADAA